LSVQVQSSSFISIRKLKSLISYIQQICGHLLNGEPEVVWVICGVDLTVSHPSWVPTLL
jgi:hypothetical protein